MIKIGMYFHQIYQLIGQIDISGHVDVSYVNCFCIVNVKRKTTDLFDLV